MVSIYFALVFVAALATATSPETTSGYFSVQVITDPNKFHPVNSSEKLIEVAGEPRASGPLYYHLGQRRPGDKLLAQNSNKFAYPFLTDIQFTLIYPAPGTGKGETINFVDVTVHQTSNTGSASIISGNIGQKHIQLLVVSTQTMYVEYTARVYGAGSRIIGNQILFIGLVATLIFKYGTDSSFSGIF